MALVSVVILCRNQAAFTAEGLRRLREGTAWRPFETVVVDNGSQDETPEVLARETEGFRAAGLSLSVVRNERNAGCSTARNQGIAAARGDPLVFLDNDCWVRTRGWVEGLLRAAAGPGAGAVQPLLVYPVTPYRIQCAGGFVSPAGQVGFWGRGEERGDPPFSAPRDLQFAVSACLLVPRKILDECGGFDEAFNPIQFEDTDLCYRIRDRGRAVRLEPGVEMYHFENVTSARSADLNYRYLTVKNGKLFRDRWRRRFEREGGPDSRDHPWRDLPPTPFVPSDSLPYL